MVFVENRDARKGLGLGLGLGFGGGGRSKMEEPELKQGEGCSFQSHKDYDDAGIDPDVDLSYIDEKLEDVLGHLLKDFEGGVSAQNLGAKFGGYGSFLPTCQLSPGWDCPRTQPKAHPCWGHKPIRSSNEWEDHRRINNNLKRLSAGKEKISEQILECPWPLLSESSNGGSDRTSASDSSVFSGPSYFNTQGWELS